MKLTTVRNLRTLLESFPPGWHLAGPDLAGDLLVIDPQGLTGARLVLGDTPKVESFPQGLEWDKETGAVIPPPPPPEPAPAPEEAPGAAEDAPAA